MWLLVSRPVTLRLCLLLPTSTRLPFGTLVVFPQNV